MTDTMWPGARQQTDSRDPPSGVARNSLARLARLMRAPREEAESDLSLSGICPISHPCGISAVVSRSGGHLRRRCQPTSGRYQLGRCSLRWRPYRQGAPRRRNPGPSFRRAGRPQAGPPRASSVPSPNSLFIKRPLPRRRKAGRRSRPAAVNIQFYVTFYRRLFCKDNCESAH